MPSTLFGTQVPAQRNNADGVSYTLATRFIPAKDGNATKGKWYFPSTIPHASARVKIGIYRNSDQALLGQALFPLAATLDAWNEVEFSSPIPLVAAVEYSVVIWTPLRYVATTTYPWPSGAGDIIAQSNGGRFVESADFAFPTNNANASYFADIVFVANDEVVTPSVTPDGIAVPVTFGEPTVQMVTTPSGIAVPVTFGSPTVVSQTPYQPEAGSGGWRSLINIMQEQRENERNDSRPVACPYDGEPLQVDSAGHLHCRFDGYTVR
jgi:hypothetical protein